MRVKVSDVIRSFLEQKGVGHVFLLSGGMMMHLLDSVSKSKTIRYVCNHHEQACAIAAEAYARETGKLGVCYATSGPGATNTVTGIAGAWLDSSPLMVITGQSRKTLTSRGLGLPAVRMVGNFEVDTVAIVQSITKYAVFVEDPKSILYHLQKAYHLATSGRRGPVLLDVPLDVQGAWVEESDLTVFEPPVASLPGLDATILQLIDHLKSSKRPLILAGNGVRISGAADSFLELVEKLGVPVVTTQLANDLMAYENSLFVGHVGLRGDRAGNFAAQVCDFLLCVGTSLHVTNTGYDLDQFAPLAFKAVVDVDEAQLQRNHVNAALSIHSDVNYFLQELVKHTGSISWDAKLWLDWVQSCRKWKKSFPIAKEAHPQEKGRINTYLMIDALSDYLVGGETVVTDAGSLYYIVGQAFKTKERQRVHVSGAFGAMGYALPASIGAAMADASKNVICITGDGSLQLCVQELATLAYYRPNVKVILNSNGGYASIRNTQVNFCEGHLAGSSKETGVGLPNWKKICDAYSIPYRTVSSLDQFSGEVKEMLDCKGPVICEVMTPENVVMLPAVTSEKLPNGSFRSNRLHQMSPQLPPERLAEAGIPVDLLPI